VIESLPVLILASNSPRRRQLLSLEGWAFHVIPAMVGENPLPDEMPLDYVMRLAREKALDVGKIAPPESTVIAADTAVVAGGQILGKPTDPAHAASMLRQLQGGSHQVITGLAILEMASMALHVDHCITTVMMRAYSQAEIHAYIATGDSLDKAGAYAIQHRSFDPVERIEGCYANVVGLPLCVLTALLDQCGVHPVRHITAGCRPDQGKACRIADLIQPDTP
jgi:nucleoside triphosphate pyrophosphatase